MMKSKTGFFFIKIIQLAMVGLSFCLMTPWPMFANAEPAVIQQSAKSSATVPSIESSKPQVLATVNGYVITQNEFDAVSLFPLSSIKDDQLRNQAKNKILRDLIDEYLVQQAIVEKKLDQDPTFKPLLLREQRSAALNLFEVYTAARTPVNLTTSDIDAFIRSHREYFEDRRTYHYIQFTIPPQTKGSVNYSVQAVRDFTGKFSQTQFMSWLIDQGIDFQRVNLWQGSEQMTPALLVQFLKMKSGSVFVEEAFPLNQKNSSSAQQDREAGAIRVIYLLDSYPDPINADEARKSIARNLISQANKLKISEMMQDLRAKAKIEISDEVLKVEITKLNQADSTQVAERIWARRLEYMRTAWFFCFLILVPLALWRFYKSVPEISKNKGSLRNLQKLEQTAYIRSLETLLAGVLLCFPLWRFISERLWGYDYKVITISAVVGLSVALALLLLIKKIPLLLELNSSRFLTLIMLFVIQYLVMVI